MAQPIQRFRAGAVTAALWENEAQVNGRMVRMLKASVERRFKDAGGEWKSSGSFSRNEIPLAIHCLQAAFDAIVARQGDEDGVSDESARLTDG